MTTQEALPYGQPGKENHPQGGELSKCSRRRIKLNIRPFHDGVWL
jgi:hypothetical protein